jgi:rubrerythrin
MPLTNFGGILGFAEEIEKQNRNAYMALAENPACKDHKELFEQFSRDSNRIIQDIERTRRENVTEMILESIRDFFRDSYIMETGNLSTMDTNKAIEMVRDLEERSQRYYLTAAEKLKALSEVSRTLKSIAKKHSMHLQKLSEM